MVNVYSAIFVWESHGSCVAFHVQVLSDGVQAVETVKHQDRRKILLLICAYCSASPSVLGASDLHSEAMLQSLLTKKSNYRDEY